MRAALVIFPGTNGEREMRAALESLGLFVIEVGERDDALPSGTDVVVLPGGFAHGDALRAGALAARSPILAPVRAHVQAGRLVIGVCNGFQILTEAGILPGVLLRNRSGQFAARDVLVAGSGRLSTYLPAPLRLPVACAVGRFYLSPTEQARAQAEGGLALRYVGGTDPNQLPEGGGEEGQGGEAVAGVLGGPRGNVLGMMPHPERRCGGGLEEPAGHGRLFFEAILRYDRERP